MTITVDRLTVDIVLLSIAYTGVGLHLVLGTFTLCVIYNQRYTHTHTPHTHTHTHTHTQKQSKAKCFAAA